ncbi:MAG: ABC transporter ATP-binding protein [Balneolales bacterium]|nr:ABC transporter ATP-binding protein [Balneolales bacterium]
MSVIKLDHITRTYTSGAVKVDALRGINFTLEEGNFVSIMGSSGSGKSTLMNILGCLDKPTNGQYLLNGIDVSNLSRNELAGIRNKTIGFVFQNFHLLARTSALENVELPLLYKEEPLSWKEIRKRAAEALEIVGLADRMDHTPSQLSGGQQQRVAIARALVTSPAILLADEPTGNLDSRTSLEIIDLFQRLNSDGLTILMVTHEPDIAHFANRIIILRDGLIQTDKSVKSRSAAKELTTWVDESEALSASEANS